MRRKPCGTNLCECSCSLVHLYQITSTGDGIDKSVGSYSASIPQILRCTYFSGCGCGRVEGAEEIARHVGIIEGTIGLACGLVVCEIAGKCGHLAIKFVRTDRLPCLCIENHIVYKRVTKEFHDFYSIILSVGIESARNGHVTIECHCLIVSAAVCGQCIHTISWCIFWPCVVVNASSIDLRCIACGLQGRFSLCLPWQSECSRILLRD